jgi:hypothetical protein
MDQLLRCARCGDVIGAYEPLVVLEAGGARQTSCAAEPQLALDDGERYHRACYDAAQADGQE